MTLAIFVVIMVLAIGCAALSWRRASRTFYAVAAMGFLAVGCGPMSAWLLGKLQSDYETSPPVAWGARNAIVLLGAGTERVAGRVEPGVFSYPRIVVAAERYRDCKKSAVYCKIVVSGGDAARTGTSEAAAYRDVFVHLGIDQADVLLEPESMNTWQNAQFSSALLQREQVDRVVLVSSAIHMRRSELYFAHFGVSATPVRADYLHAITSALPLSYNFTLADVALHEYLGIARYHLYNRLGWNPARHHPGQA
ncbi:YdcF family protein [Bordetella muralis]|uniref:YdcF family protein n=1 Tax=Bordetella muralis TaxID=1649130 RepID=UPI0039EF4DF8